MQKSLYYKFSIVCSPKEEKSLHKQVAAVLPPCPMGWIPSKRSTSTKRGILVDSPLPQQPSNSPFTVLQLGPYPQGAVFQAEKRKKAEKSYFHAQNIWMGSNPILTLHEQLLTILISNYHTKLYHISRLTGKLRDVGTTGKAPQGISTMEGRSHNTLSWNFNGSRGQYNEPPWCQLQQPYGEGEQDGRQHWLILLFIPMGYTGSEK